MYSRSVAHVSASAYVRSSSPLLSSLAGSHRWFYHSRGVLDFAAYGGHLPTKDKSHAHTRRARSVAVIRHSKPVKNVKLL